MTDWLMVIITFVYVVATIFICVFNYRSAKAAKEQIELSKLQYEDDTRLKLMPCLFIERIAPLDFVNGSIEYKFVDSKPVSIETVVGDLYFKITNVGSGIAKNIHYFMDPGASGYRRYHIPSFPVNDCRTLKFSFTSKHGTNQELNLYISYTDLLDNEYDQILSIFLDCSSNEIKLTTFHITAPQYRKRNEKENVKRDKRS